LADLSHSTRTFIDLIGKAFEPTKPILLDSLRITAAMRSESSNIGLVGIAFEPTKAILLDSLRIAAVMCSESSNIGLVVLAIYVAYRI
jgi:hypothetical protein